jgi:hypothetical protein
MPRRLCHDGLAPRRRAADYDPTELQRDRSSGRAFERGILTPGEYEGFLSVIGQILDADGARQVEIIDHETGLTVSWLHTDPTGTRRWFEDLEIDFLREGARELQEGGGGGGPQEAALRRLGRELDRSGVQLSGIVEEEDGYGVSGLVDRRYTNRLYTWAELAAARPETTPGGHAPADDRGGPRSPRRPWWRFWSR